MKNKKKFFIMKLGLLILVLAALVLADPPV
jgi:hypothetical protein